jgi:8-oxo-dGTP pyrophosphatase MutT (NUDIX family)
MLYQGDLAKFQPKMQCVGCYLEHEGEILLLQKWDNHQYYPSKWGVVAGKIDFQEPPRAAIAREIREEAGYAVAPGLLCELNKLPVIHPHFSFFYHLFRLEISGDRPQIRLSPEHCSFQWLAPRLAMGLDLIEDEAEVISLHYATSVIKARS